MYMCVFKRHYIHSYYYYYPGEAEEDRRAAGAVLVRDAELDPTPSK